MLWRHLPLAGVLLFRSGSRGQTVRDALLVALIALLIGQAVAAGSATHMPRLLVDEHRAVFGALQVAGAVLLFGGIALLAAAQLNMGASWRIGIDEGAAPGLVSRGLYRFCRHPIYLGLLTAIAGYAAMLPTRLSVALLVAAYIGARVQAAAEEAYLIRTYGDAYRGYGRRVGRFLPKIGRL